MYYNMTIKVRNITKNAMRPNYNDDRTDWLCGFTSVKSQLRYVRATTLFIGEMLLSWSGYKLMILVNIDTGECETFSRLGEVLRSHIIVNIYSVSDGRGSSGRSSSTCHIQAVNVNEPGKLLTYTVRDVTLQGIIRYREGATADELCVRAIQNRLSTDYLKFFNLRGNSNANTVHNTTRVERPTSKERVELHRPENSDGIETRGNWLRRRVRVYKLKNLPNREVPLFISRNNIYTLVTDISHSTTWHNYSGNARRKLRVTQWNGTFGIMIFDDYLTCLNCGFVTQKRLTVAHQKLEAQWDKEIKETGSAVNFSLYPGRWRGYDHKPLRISPVR